MSSHHVIRDEQEPPVFILDIDTDIEQMVDLLGWSPTLWVAEPLVERIISMNIKIDGILVMDSDHLMPAALQNGDYLIKKMNIEDILSTVMECLESKKYTGVNIFCNSAQKEKILVSLQNSSDLIPFSLFTGAEITIISYSERFKKWYPKNQCIEVLQGELESKTILKKESRGFRVEKEGFLRINIEKAPIIITEF